MSKLQAPLVGPTYSTTLWEAGEIVRGERGLFWGPTSMVPQPYDFVQFWQQLKWFVGAGNRIADMRDVRARHDQKFEVPRVANSRPRTLLRRACYFNSVQRSCRHGLLLSDMCRPWKACRVNGCSAS